ncbi:MAG: hypothetical protein LBK25_05670 [Treponema sp.]|nr:hypothetical protein [Treponema sp.]
MGVQHADTGTEGSDLGTGHADTGTEGSDLGIRGSDTGTRGSFPPASFSICSLLSTTC